MKPLAVRQSRTDSDKKGFAIAGLVAIVIVLVAVALVLWHRHRVAANDSPRLGETYCNTTGKICLSYPKGWELRTDHQLISITNPRTKTSVDYMPQTASAADPCSCFFKTESAVVSAGFSNADDVAGIFQDKSGANGITPQYFLIATKQLLDDGLRLNATTDVETSDIVPTFVNGSLTQLTQSLEVIPPPTTPFKTVVAAEDWLRSQDARTAAAIVNSVHSD